MMDEGIINQQVPALLAGPSDFPDSDGRFLPENSLQANAIVSLRNDLRQYFQEVANVVVEGNMFLYYDASDGSKWCSPDVFVVLDHDLGGRQKYDLWVEGKPPDFAIEVIPPTSRINSCVRKKELYESLGVKEYFLFQPNEHRPEPRLVGFRLWGKRYVKIRDDPYADPPGSVRSVTLGVSLRPGGALLRVRDLATRKDLLWAEEQSSAIKVEKQEKEEAIRATHIAKQRADAAELRAAAADQRAAAAKEQTRQEADARRASEARVAELQARVAELQAQLARSGETQPD